MKVKVRYVGALFDYIGVLEDVLELDDSEDYTIADILEAVRAIRPKFRTIESLLPIVWVFINNKQVLPTDKVKVRDGDVVLLMPTLYEGG